MLILCQVWGHLSIRGQNIKVHPDVFAVNISFHVLDMSRFEKKLVWVKCVCVWGGGGGCTVGGCSPCPN